MTQTLLTMDENRFYLNGEPFDLQSGDFHYFRTLPGGWHHRLALMKAFGLNCVQTYVPWNLHEPEKGHYDFTGHLDIHAFLTLCQEMGLYVLLRPAPYICSECDWGGLPYWLMNEHCAVRTSDSIFMGHYGDYFRRLAKEFLPMLSTNGGPILAVAVENEYGSYGNDREYLHQTAELYRQVGIDVPLYNTDGDTYYMLTNGGPAEIWSGINVAEVTERSVETYRHYQTEFPLYVGEMWGGRAVQWGGRFARQSAETIAARYQKALSLGAHVNFYMFCGGTSFGSFSGANHGLFRADAPGARERYIPFTTSYDVDAPVTEDGRATEKYYALRSVLAAYRGMEENDLPPVPENPPVQVAGEIQWQDSRTVFAPSILETLTERHVVSGGLRTMEELGQDYGFLLYTTTVPLAHPDYRYTLRINGLQDRADIYVDGTYRGTYYRDRDNEPITFQVTGESARLDILVENMGRICFGYKLAGERRGILENVQLDLAMGEGKPYRTNAILMHWEHRTLPFRPTQVEKAFALPDEATDQESPKLYRGTFTATPGVDTFLQYGDVPGMNKGQVWINGFPVGRYWHIGPQKALYVPGELLQAENRIEVLELYPTGIPGARFRDSHMLDELTENVEIVLR